MTEVKTENLSKEVVDEQIDNKIKKWAKFFGFANIAVIIAAGLSFFGKFDDAWQASVNEQVEQVIQSRFDIYEGYAKSSSDRVIEKSGQSIIEIQKVDTIINETNVKADALREAIATSENGALIQLVDVIENRTEGDFFDVKNDIKNLEEKVSKSITECRICMQTNNDSQCYPRNGTFCSDYTHSGGEQNWTTWVRDDTDKRSGGCGYRYSIQCK